MDGIATVEERTATQVAAGETELITEGLGAQDPIEITTRFAGTTQSDYSSTDIH